MADRTQSSLTRGILAGAFGGLVASWVMNGFIAAVTTAQKSNASPQQGAGQDAQNPQKADATRDSEGEQPSEDSTMKVADSVAWLVTGEHLSREAKEIGGPIVHYAFGTLNGAMYGAVAALAPAVTAGCGTAFGTALFIGADEVVVPALVTGEFPTSEGASSQLMHYAAHLVYGATTELVRRALA